ncbi:MAG TPA: 6-carboxytetrahydropterin synthase [Elusimicrobiota bacterium]|jgi:6-pyruvoyltetrahydropterin/6-carboxytetrahydropterin synthase|nr:6-carboxytetrahydropterin synthase [Elusimicrobiota bacterium]
MNHSVTRLIHFCYGHRLLEYAGKCRHLHGHNGQVEVRCESAKLDKLGMVLDFDEIKQKVQKWIDVELDHKLLLNEKDPLIPDLRKGEQPIVLFKGNPTAEAIARHIYEYAKSQKLPVTSVRVWETPSSFAEYRES